MIKLKRQILMTTCLVFLLPHISIAAENEHERYVPKEILAIAKSKLEAQALAIGGLVENVIDHGSAVETHEVKTVKAVRMVGPIVDFEKAAGIKQSPMNLDAHSSENQSVETEVMDTHRKVSDMHGSSTNDSLGGIHGDLGKAGKIVDLSLGASKDEDHKNLEMLAEGHSEKEERSGEHTEASQKPKMFISVFDEQPENVMRSKGSEHGMAGQVDKEHVDTGQGDAHGDDEHVDVKDGHSETKDGDEHGEGGEHAEPEIVFETVEVPTELNKPTREIRALQRLQDRLVAGVPNSFDLYRSRLIKAGKVLKSVDSETWQYKKNLDAMALFTLIGGDPRVGKMARSKTKLSKNHTLYLDAALAYSSGRLGRAYVLFKKIEFKHLPVSTAAQFAIVKSMLFGRHDAKLAKDYLNFAREFAPGTLAEEAALRRLIRMSSDDKDVKLFMRISRIYISRFKNSFYFNDFLKNYAYSLVRMPKTSEDEILTSLKKLFKSLKSNQQLAVASYVSGITTEMGMFKLSAWTAKSALSLSRKNGKLHTRMKLYHLASTVTNLGAVDGIMDMIEGINDDILNAKDKQLYNSIIALSERIYNDPMTQDQIRIEIKSEVQKSSKVDPTEKLFKESAEFARKNITIMKSVDILAKSEEVLKGSIL